MMAWETCHIGSCQYHRCCMYAPCRNQPLRDYGHSVHKLQAAEAPAKADMLTLLDKARAEVESGETVALVVLPIHTGDEFSVRSAGAIKMIALAGVLSAAWHDAIEALRT